MPETTTLPIHIPDGCPAHLRDRTDRLVLLQRWANGVAGYYGEPVYLCGSALRDDNTDPRDWDVRVRLTDRDFEMRFGPAADWTVQGQTGAWDRTRWRWSDACVKRTHEAWQQTKLNVDFQVYPEAFWASFDGKPRMRLDTRWAALSQAELEAAFRYALHRLCLPNAGLYRAVADFGEGLQLDALQRLTGEAIEQVCKEIHDAELYAEHWPPPGGLL